LRFQLLRSSPIWGELLSVQILEAAGVDMFGSPPTAVFRMNGGCKGDDAGFPQMLRAAAVNISLRSKHAHTSYKADPLVR
jgi:hypothetical protein